MEHKIILILSLRNLCYSFLCGYSFTLRQKNFVASVPHLMIRSGVFLQEDYLITHLNNFNFPLNGGYFTAGSNQVGVFIMAFLWLKVSKEYLP